MTDRVKKHFNFENGNQTKMKNVREQQLRLGGNPYATTVVCGKTQLFVKRRVAWYRITASLPMTQLIVKDAVCWLPLASSVWITGSKSKIEIEIRF